MTLLLLAASPLALVWLLIYIVVFLIIAGLIFWCINRLSAAFGIPEPIRTVVIVLLVVVIVIGLLYFLMSGAAIPRWKMIHAAPSVGVFTVNGIGNVTDYFA